MNPSQIVASSFVGLLFLLSASYSSAQDSATSVNTRIASWVRHEAMRDNSPFANLDWQSIGPEFQGGRIECIATDPERSSTIYVGVGSGGLWKSINNGTTWTPIFERQASIAIGDVAVAPSQPDTVWLGTGEVLLARSALPGMGVYKSVDGGESWSNMGLQDTQHIARVLVHPSQPETVYVAAIGHQNSANEERGVYRTLDGGQTWEKVLYINESTAAIDLVMDPQEPQTLYASMWQRSLANQEHFGSESGIYKSEDGGASWQRLEQGLPRGDHVGRIAIAIAPSQPNIVYALADEGRTDGFYCSRNGGQSWTRISEQLQARWDWCEIQVSPSDPSEVYSIGQNSFVTRDGGEHFQQIAGDVVHLKPHGANVIHLDTHAMWINPSDPDHLMFGTDGGLYVTHDRCRTWLHHNNMPIAECYAVTYDESEPFRVYIGTQDNAAMFGPVTHRPRVRRPDLWQHVYLDRWGGGDSYFTYRDPDDERTIYYEHQYGAMRRKDMQSGETVNIQPELPDAQLRFAWMTPFFLSKFNRQTLYCGANYVFKSMDRGDSWTPISEDLVGEIVVPGLRYRAITTLAESPIQPGLLVAGTDNADLHVTLDDGAQWTTIDEGLPRRAFTRVCPSIHDTDVMYVSQSGAGLDDFAAYVFRSDDLGKTWASISDGLPSEPVNVIVEDPHVADLLYVGTDMGVYASLDAGRTWLSLSANLPTVSVYDLFVHPRENMLVIGTHGRSVYAVDAREIQRAAMPQGSLESP